MKTKYDKFLDELIYLLVFRATTPEKAEDEYLSIDINKEKALDEYGIKTLGRRSRINDTFDKLSKILSDEEIELWETDSRPHDKLSKAGEELRKLIDEVDFINKFKDLMNDIQNINTKFREYIEVYTEISIAAHLVTQLYFIPERLKKFEKDNDYKIYIDLKACPHNQIVRMIQDSEVDLGLVDIKVFDKFPSKIIDEGICYSPKWKVIFNHKSRFLNKININKKELSLTDLRNIPIAFRNNPERLATKKLISRLNVVYRCDSIEIMKALVRKDCCISIVPEEIILPEENNIFKVFDLESDLPSMEIHIIRRQNKSLSKNLEQLISILNKQ